MGLPRSLEDGGGARGSGPPQVVEDACLLGPGPSCSRCSTSPAGPAPCRTMASVSAISSLAAAAEVDRGACRLGVASASELHQAEPLQEAEKLGGLDGRGQPPELQPGALPRSGRPARPR
jgi:hypothetical protein